MELKTTNQDWVFKVGESDIATLEGDMPVMAYTIAMDKGDYYAGANILRPLLLKGGQFLTPDNKRFTGIVYAYTPCAIPVFPKDRPLCIFQELDTGVVLAAGRFQIRRDSTSVYLNGRTYRIEDCNYDASHFFVDGVVYVTVSDLEHLLNGEREQQIGKVQARTDRISERSARLVVESKMSEIQTLIDARVAAMNARRADVHPSYQTDFDILLLKLSKKFTRRSDLARDVLAGHDLFASLTMQLDSDFTAFDSFFTRSARRYERDAWLEQTTKEHGELVGVPVAADACGTYVATYRHKLKRLGVSVFTCAILWGGAGGSSTYITKKDADRLTTTTNEKP